MGSKLANFYRQAHKEETTCALCKSPLVVKCRANPSPTNPRGVFEVIPCPRHVKREPLPPGPTNPVMRCFRGQTGKVSALHAKIREALCLEALGFVSEQKVGPYRCDEVHHERRIIVEVNGDYVHANPRKYRAGAKIVLERAKYTAAEKRAADAKRTARLEALGYRVLVVWESDKIDAAREALWTLLRAT